MYGFCRSSLPTARSTLEDTSEGRTGMYTTGLVVQQAEHTICLYFAGAPMLEKIWRRC